MVAIVGRPNVGKSTLLNHLLGQKLSITSRKPQTTRHQVLGVSTVENTQLIYVDTPGMHLGQSKAINRAMNKAAASALNDVDLTCFYVTAPSGPRRMRLCWSWLADSAHPLLLSSTRST